MKGQKQAVVDMVKAFLPGFQPNKDIALVMLTRVQLEALKAAVGLGIVRGEIEYSKDKTNQPEVAAYARAMVMNHLKKAKELNGNQTYGESAADSKVKSDQKKLSNIKMDILPEDLRAFVNNLV